MSLRTLDELKDDILIEDVLAECGAEFNFSFFMRGQEIPFLCPFHLNINTPAASMNPMKGVFHCYGCGAGGSIIDAALLHLGTTDISEAASWLEETFLS